jgi:peptide/nickel transport system permease protein
MTTAAPAADLTVASPRRRRVMRLWRRFIERRPAVLGLLLATTFVLAALLAPWIAPADPGASDFDAVLTPPSAGHMLGTDELGRDVLSRIVFGARASIQAGVLAIGLAMVVAVPIGLVSGYYRSWLDAIVGRLVDTMLSFPFLVLAVGLAAILGPSLTNASIAIGVTQVPIFIRITRGETLSVREEDFVAGAVADGAGDLTILLRHVLPNIANPLLVQATVAIPTAIIAESILSFLGLGVTPPTPSWGVMLSTAQPYLSDALWLAVFPGLAIFLATLSFNLLGDGLRDVLDPRALS